MIANHADLARAGGLFGSEAGLRWAHTAALSGGDDYELLFTAPAAAREALTALSSQLDLPLHRIGQMHADGTAGRIDLLDTQQQPIDLASVRHGYDHFA